MVKLGKLKGKKREKFPTLRHVALDNPWRLETLVTCTSDLLRYVVPARALTVSSAAGTQPLGTRASSSGSSLRCRRPRARAMASRSKRTVSARTAGPAAPPAAASSRWPSDQGVLTKQKSCL